MLMKCHTNVNSTPPTHWRIQVHQQKGMKQNCPVAEYSKIYKVIRVIPSIANCIYIFHI
jgi:hypothetical protein